MKIHPAQYPKGFKRRRKDKSEDGVVSILATSLRHQTREFFENSTLHGVRYIAEKDRPFCERFMWFCFTSVGAIATCIIIVNLWEKFQTNPTITGLDTDFHNWDVPFPALTLCDQRPADEELIQSFVNNDPTLDKSSMEAKIKAGEFLRWLSGLSYSSIEEEAINFVSDPNLVDNPAFGNLKDVVFSVVARCEKLLYDCEWKSEPEECCEVFYPVFTEMGFCYAFNSRHAERKWPWQTEDAEPYQEQFIHETDTKWSFVFNAISNDTVMNVYIHSTEEMAGIDMSPQHVWDRKVEKVSFSVKQTYTTADARQLSIKQRRCVFADEVKLETSKVYTYSACTRQCRMRLARSYCGCVPHFYPTIEGYKQCSLPELSCIARHVGVITDVSRCSCELGCAHTVYEVEKLTELDISKVGESQTPLEAEFVSWPMVRYKREVLFGWVDLLVSFGGIAGLFLGFSLLSGVEIIYYFKLRAWCASLRERDTLLAEKRERELRPPPPYDLSLVPWFIRPPSTTITTTRTSPKTTLQVQPSQLPPQYSPPPLYGDYVP